MLIWIQLFVSAIMGWVLLKILYQWCLFSGTQVLIQRLSYILALRNVLVFSRVLSSTCLPNGNCLLLSTWKICPYLCDNAWVNCLPSVVLLPSEDFVSSLFFFPWSVCLTCSNNCSCLLGFWFLMVRRWNQGVTYPSPLSWQGTVKSQPILPVHEVHQKLVTDELYVGLKGEYLDTY